MKNSDLSTLAALVLLIISVGVIVVVMTGCTQKPTTYSGGGSVTVNILPDEEVIVAEEPIPAQLPAL